MQYGNIVTFDVITCIIFILIKAKLEAMRTRKLKSRINRACIDCNETNGIRVEIHNIESLFM